MTALVERLGTRIIAVMGGDALSINKGRCEEFANMLRLALIAHSNIRSQWMDTDYFTSRLTDDWDVDLLTNHWSSPPPGVKPVGHSWLFLDGKHYDAEQLHGVTDFFQLPIFARIRTTP